MAYRQRREKLRSILQGERCINPGSVYDAISIRIAEGVDSAALLSWSSISPAASCRRRAWRCPSDS